MIITRDYKHLITKLRRIFQLKMTTFIYSLLHVRKIMRLPEYLSFHPGVEGKVSTLNAFWQKSQRPK